MKLLDAERVMIEVVERDKGHILVDGKPLSAVFVEKTGYGQGTRIKGNLTIIWEDVPSTREETSPV